MNFVLRHPCKYTVVIYTYIGVIRNIWIERYTLYLVPANRVCQKTSKIEKLSIMSEMSKLSKMVKMVRMSKITKIKEIFACLTLLSMDFKGKWNLSFALF